MSSDNSYKGPFDCDDDDDDKLEGEEDASWSSNSDEEEDEQIEFIESSMEIESFTFSSTSSLTTQFVLPSIIPFTFISTNICFALSLMCPKKKKTREENRRKFPFVIKWNRPLIQMD